MRVAYRLLVIGLAYANLISMPSKSTIVHRERSTAFHKKPEIQVLGSSFYFPSLVLKLDEQPLKGSLSNHQGRAVFVSRRPFVNACHNPINTVAAKPLFPGFDTLHSLFVRYEIL